jgi:hypothetical protein
MTRRFMRVFCGGKQVSFAGGYQKRLFSVPSKNGKKCTKRRKIFDFSVLAWYTILAKMEMIQKCKILSEKYTLWKEMKGVYTYVSQVCLPVHRRQRLHA